MITTTDRIRELNDAFRKNPIGGTALITPGVAALGTEAVAESRRPSPSLTISATRTIRMASTTLASFDVEGHSIFFKIDYYDRSLTSTRRTLRTRPLQSA